MRNLTEDQKEFIEGAICFVIVFVVIFGGLCLMNWDNVTVNFK